LRVVFSDVALSQGPMKHDYEDPGCHAVNEKEQQTSAAHFKDYIM
jgi:hypothetical protein